jgi:hypothetical protein
LAGLWVDAIPGGCGRVAARRLRAWYCGAMPKFTRRDGRLLQAWRYRDGYIQGVLSTNIWSYASCPGGAGDPGSRQRRAFMVQSTGYNFPLLAGDTEQLMLRLGAETAVAHPGRWVTTASQVPCLAVRPMVNSGK